MENKKPIVVVAIYLRKSRAEDGVQDLAKHKDYLISIAKRNGWQYELYEEIDSSQDINRAELQRLRADIKLGKIDAVLVHAVDRLTRKSRHFLEIIEDYFIEQGMTKLFVKDTEHDLLDTHTITMLQFQATMSQAEYSFIASRMKDGKVASLSKGIMTGVAIFGYMKHPKTKLLIPHPEESKVVIMIKDMLLQGMAYRSICIKLNGQGYKTRRGKFFDVHNIKSIAHSPTTRGHIVCDFKGQLIEVKDAHEALMTEAEYTKINQILTERAENYKGLARSPKHYLQGLLKCPKCNKVMSIAVTKHRKIVKGVASYTGESDYYIRSCRHIIPAQIPEHCGNTGCKAEVIEEAVKQTILSYKAALVEKIQQLMQLDKQAVKGSKKADIKALKDRLYRLDIKETNLADMLAEEVITREKYNSLIAKNKKEMADIQAQINEAEAQYDALDIEQDIKQLEGIVSLIDGWDSLSNETKRKTIQMTFKEIIYSKFDKNGQPELTFIPYE